jgi:hypothetical protein
MEHHLAVKIAKYYHLWQHGRPREHCVSWKS